VNYFYKCDDVLKKGKEAQTIKVEDNGAKDIKYNKKGLIYRRSR